MNVQNADLSVHTVAVFVSATRKCELGSIGSPSQSTKEISFLPCQLAWLGSIREHHPELLGKSSPADERNLFAVGGNGRRSTVIVKLSSVAPECCDLPQTRLPPGRAQTHNHVSTVGKPGDRASTHALGHRHRMGLASFNLAKIETSLIGKREISPIGRDGRSSYSVISRVGGQLQHPKWQGWTIVRQE